MRRLFAYLIALACQAPSSGLAQDGAMTRVLVCKNADAVVEVYAPHAIVTGRSMANINLTRPVSGFYALDLTQQEKGKTLEPARISLSGDKQSIVIEQATRKLPPTRVPVGGGTVSFDKRFAEDMVCEPFNGG